MTSRVLLYENRTLNFMSLSLTFANTTAFLVFDREGSAANQLDEAALDELAARLDELDSEPHVTGLLIYSAKPHMFITGADPLLLSGNRKERLTRITTKGQVLLNRIADLSFPTVAAFHGACLGGGFELALACDWRVAGDCPSTQIGLPQTRLGLLPAWGGTTRLPDLLGLQDALPLILYGDRLSAAEARRKGLVDEIVPLEHLKAHALTYLDKGKRHHTHNPIVHNQAVAAVIRVQAQKDLIRKNRGHHPAQEAALEVAVASIGRQRVQSQQAEHDAIIRLSELPEMAHMLRFSHLQERAEYAVYTSVSQRQIRRAVVIGAGPMGSGIAQQLSASGVTTILQDGSTETLAHSMESIVAMYSAAEKCDALSKIEAARGLDLIHPVCGQVPLGICDLIIDSTEGELVAGREIFTELASQIRPDALLVSQNSTQSVRALAATVVRPERVVGLQFFHPVDRTHLVEVVRTDLTSDETLAVVLAFVRGLGKLPVVVRDSPCFLVNRILMPYLVKAVSLFEQGGDPDEIDNAMLDFGMPVGPLRFLDEMGLDTAMSIARTLAHAFPGRMVIPMVVEKLLEAGHTGRKGGSGFYVHDSAAPAVNAEVIAFQTGTESTPSDTSSVLVGVIAEEARLCLAEGLVESVDDIDLAMILAAGYPAFRGGPLGNR